MGQRSHIPPVRRPAANDAVRFLFHPSFEESDAEELYGEGGSPEMSERYTAQHMPDDVTRDLVRRMHYAGWRSEQAATMTEAWRWQSRYYALRDAVVMGNRKLVFRAVHRWPALAHRSEDLIGECYIVLIRAVAVYNPWLGVRFSTYAYTCLIRALARLSQRFASDWLTRSVPLDLLSADGPEERETGEPAPGDRLQRLDEFFRDDHPLLSKREKAILLRRFCPNSEVETQTLERVGRDLGLSKERVRQVQAAALAKLRKALDENTAATC